MVEVPAEEAAVASLSKAAHRWSSPAGVGVVPTCATGASSLAAMAPSPPTAAQVAARLAAAVALAATLLYRAYQMMVRALVAAVASTLTALLVELFSATDYQEVKAP